MNDNLLTNNEIKDFKKKSINILLKNNILLTPEYIEKFNSLNSKEEILEYTNTLLLKDNKSEVKDSSLNNLRPGNVRITNSYQDHFKKRTVSDFVQYYNNRFQALSGILRKRDVDNLTSIDKIKSLYEKEQISTIAMVYDVGETKNGHFVLELEDKTGIIKGIIMKNNEELIQIAKNIVLDEVIAVSGVAGKDVIFINDIIFPDIPLNNTIKTTPEEVYAVFTGDPQIGSKHFYKENFQKFIDWISNKKVSDKHKDIVSKIKYLIIPGDIIEGVGIFPGQENELEFQSVIEQYNLVYEYLKQIPEHIQIIMCPGNHDAVRLAEPQPAFTKKYLGNLLKLKNLHLISSPGMVSIEETDNFQGINILLYHGFSLPYYGDKVPEIRENGGLSNMSAIMKFYLQRRHFAPSHGSTQFIPDIRFDPMVIEKIPDIFVTGHVHKISVDSYKNVLMMNTSAWVAPTEYQSRFGLIPDNCRAVLVNLKTRDIKILNFESEEDS